MQIPRKLHADDRYESARELQISIDGVVQKYVVSYDIDAGTVERLVTDGDGRFVIVDDEIKRETITGVVTVDLK